MNYLKKWLKHNLKLRSRSSHSVPKLAFIHVPKCAGTSLIASLKPLYESNSLRSLNLVKAYQALRSSQKQWDNEQWQIAWIHFRQTLLRMYLLEENDLVYGHFPCSLPWNFSAWEKYYFLTVLRDPVERFISNYIYDKTGPGIRIENKLPPTETTLKKELDAYLDTAEAKWLAREQVIMLGGLGFDQNYDSQQAVARAKKTIDRFSFVGFSEDMDQVQYQLSHLLNMSVKLPTFNTTQQWVDQEGFSKKDYNTIFNTAVREKIRSLSKDDYQVYHYAKSLFSSRSF